jgi:predicted transcriptional regulator of viral defense system
MALINARVSEVIAYGFVSALTYVGLTMYKPRYWYCTANVQHI